MIKAEHLRKRFREKEVLKDITMEFQPNHVYVLIAPNGMGKRRLSIFCVDLCCRMAEKLLFRTE